jgi:hypothetical protein
MQLAISITLPLVFIFSLIKIENSVSCPTTMQILCANSTDLAISISHRMDFKTMTILETE